MASHRVKFGNVTIEVKPWRHPSGRNYFRFRYYDQKGSRQTVTRAELAEAKEQALKVAQQLAKGSVDLNALDPGQIRAIRRMLDADPKLELVEEFLAWKAREYPDKLVSEAVEAFLATKDANKGRSIQNLRTLRRDLKPLADIHAGQNLREITIENIESIVNKAGHGSRTRRNRRASIVTFFRWCRERGWLPEGKTAAEKAETPIVSDRIPETYSPDEMGKMLAEVRPQFLPWLVLSAFAGIRREEIYPLAGGTKSPLDWADIKWDRNIIEIRPETAKTKRRRIVPILPVLRDWLYHHRQDLGPVGLKGQIPHKEGETGRLGALVGGWRKNALRHSFISYRAAMVGLAQTAMEAGNSEAEARRSYNDAKGKDEATEYFGLTMEEVAYRCASSLGTSENKNLSL